MDGIHPRIFFNPGASTSAPLAPSLKGAEARWGGLRPAVHPRGARRRPVAAIWRREQKRIALGLTLSTLSSRSYCTVQRSRSGPLVPAPLASAPCGRPAGGVAVPLGLLGCPE